MRRLLLLGSTVVFLDVVFYEAIIPLLPEYVDDLGLSKAAAGLLSAAYAAGTLVAALPAGLMAARVGPRRTLISGLALLGVASLVFGFGNQVVLLDAARFVQGVGGALAWAGALTWLILATPEKRRGSVIGDVLGVAIAGALLGPAVGALAGEVGTEPVFSSVLVLTAALSVAALRIPEPERGPQQQLGEVWEAITSPPVLRATWYVAAPSAMFGLIAVLVPLRIDELGGGAGLVAGGFMLGAGLEAIMAPLVGRLSDRVGRLRPYTVGMLISAAAIAVVPAPETLGLMLAVLIVTSLGAGICFVPALAMLSDSAEATDLHQGLAAGLINIAWASGQVFGGVAGGVAAAGAGDALPCLLAAALLLATIAAARLATAPAAPTGYSRPGP
ncbi:MAG TPA: MFS transporter [Solirubrobacterales bacterium]|nr:MFS transporter [Solirubrobacterales bacterium]